MNLDFIGIPVIIIICYMVAEIYKVVFKKNTKTYKLIPILVAFLGGVLGVIIYFTSSEVLLNVENVYNAILVGTTSGFSATGTNQIIKQIFIKKEGN